MGTPFESEDDETNRTLRRGRSHPATITSQVSALTSSDFSAAKPVIIANIPYWQYQKHSGHWMGFSWFLWLNETFISQVSSGVYGFSSERDSFVKNECKWFNGGFIECRREVMVLSWSNSNFSLPICANGLYHLLRANCVVIITPLKVYVFFSFQSSCRICRWFEFNVLQVSGGRCR